MAVEDREIDYFNGTDREAERWRIEAFAQRQREKWPPETNVRRPGYERRRAMDWFTVGQRLAKLQSRIDSESKPFEDPKLGFRALLIIWPILMPYSCAKRRLMTRKQVERSRDRLGAKLGWPGFAFLSMWKKQGFGDRDYFDFPRIRFDRRTRAEWSPSSNETATTRDREHGDEVIGRAVIAEYRSHPADRRSIDSAWTVVASRPAIDGIAVRGRDNVRAQYFRYRKRSHERGYADARAFWAEVDELPWPEDQIWLEDFPAQIP